MGYKVHSFTLFMTMWWHQPSSTEPSAVGAVVTADRKKLDKQIRKAGSVLGYALDPVEVVG